MVVSRALSQITKSISTHCSRITKLLSPSHYQHSSILSNPLHSLYVSPNQVSLLHHSAFISSGSKAMFNHKHPTKDADLKDDYRFTDNVLKEEVQTKDTDLKGDHRFTNEEVQRRKKLENIINGVKNIFKKLREVQNKIEKGRNKIEEDRSKLFCILVLILLLTILF